MTGVEPYEDWEIPGLRMTLPEELQPVMGSSTTTVGVSRRKLALMQTEHAADKAYFTYMRDILENYEYWGLSQKKDRVLELYKRVENIWFTVVIYPPGQNTTINSLGTMHRIARRKVENRIRNYLKSRDALVR